MRFKKKILELKKNFQMENSPTLILFG